MAQDFQDKTLKCVECGNDFVFSASEQEFYQEKGFTNVEEKSNMKIDGCHYVISCQSASAWDIANYTTQIHLKLYEEGETISEAHYTHKQNLSFNKFINTKEMVNKMLNGMMPNTKKLKTRYDKKRVESDQYYE